MWVTNKNDWSSSHGSLSKYFIEKIKQQVDYEEIISNRHRTSNGFILIAELKYVAGLVLKRPQTISRLLNVLNEAIDKNLNSSVTNDYIVKKYFPDIHSYFNNFQIHKIRTSDKSINSLSHQCELFIIRLEKYYYYYIIQELKTIDIKSEEFVRNSNILDQLLDALVPYLLFKGYSATSLSDTAYRVIQSNHKNPILQFAKSFNGELQNCKFLLHTRKSEDEVTSLISFIEKKKYEYSLVDFENIKDKLYKEIQFDRENDILIEITHKTLDPHNFIRNLYERGVRHFVTTKDRISLQYFNVYFEKTYWRFCDTKNHKFNTSNNHLDPINVKRRGSTFRETLETLARSKMFEYKPEEPIKIIESIQEPLFYYNMALGSKSIENSLFLLWTSLETLLPQRSKGSDIENVQYYVSSYLNSGAVGRQLLSFVQRFTQLNKQNNWELNSCGTNTFGDYLSVQALMNWSAWLSTSFDNESDPYKKIKPYSELLCKEFCNLNDIFSKSNSPEFSKFCLSKIEKSNKAISYQLDRIYLHRNQIVHSGKFINEYSNLWSHLEWYVGKLISYCYVKDYEWKLPTFDKLKAFNELESDNQHLINVLTIESTKQQKNVKEIYKVLYKNSWQFFLTSFPTILYPPLS